MPHLGIDIGGTKVGVALIEGRKVVHHKTTPTVGFEATVEAVLGLSRQFASSVDAVGIGCAGPLDLEKGLVLNDDTLHGWFQKDIVSPFRDAFGAPVALLNDADAALLGEIALGALSTCQTEPAAMLTLGTGVGGSIWIGHSLIVGAFGEHPEVGHFQVDPDGPQCYCGTKGCMESMISGTALNARAKQLGLPNIESLFAQHPEELQRARAALERGIWGLASIVRPARVVLGGGIADAFFDQLAPEDGLACKEATMLSQPIEVVRAKMGNRAGVVGAAYAAGGAR